MRFDVITIFPQMIEQAAAWGVIGKAAQQNLLTIHAVDLRDYCHDSYRQVDDTPYGGGPGMVMKPEPFFEAVDDIKDRSPGPAHVVLLTPQGATFNQAKARDLAKHEHLILLCARYEGVDERVCEALVDEEISVGDYVLSGGELAALIIIDAVSRLVPGVLGNENSIEQESHSEKLLEYPQYTRPAQYRGMSVPDVLAHGYHEQIRVWRRIQALKRTAERRPDMFAAADFTDEDWKLLGEF